MAEPVQIKYRVQVKLPGINGIAKHIKDEIQKAVAETALLIEGTAKQLAPVDTGFLRSTIIAYGGAMKTGAPGLQAIRKAGRAGGRAHLGISRSSKKLASREAIAPLQAPGRFQARVGPHTNYAVYQERIRRFMLGSVIKNKPRFVRNVKRAFARAADRGI